MITTKLVALEKQLSEALPDFRVRKTLMLLPPVSQVLRGVWFDRSAYDEVSFSLTAFVMPLCVPTEHFYFNFGDRIRHEDGGDRWSFEMPDLAEMIVRALKEKALPFLSSGGTLEGFIEIAKTRSQAGRTLEALGYALARAGETKQAVEVLDKLVPMLNPTIAWQRDLVDQVHAFSAKLVEHPKEAQEQLAKWEEKTVQNLGLEEFRQVA